LAGRVILWLVTVLRRAAVLAALLGCAVPATAAAATRSATSSNWAGYAVSKAGTTFTRVSGTWVQPNVTCTASRRRYSAHWLGLGGLHTYSKALEQIGTEADCIPGAPVHSVWYEIVPAAPVSVHITVRPGDTISASVTVTGRSVKLFLANRTRGTTFSKQLVANQVDLTSAEWISEAPSACFGNGDCATLPLANFGTASFANARATSSTGHVGPIADPAWSPVAITLSSHHRGGARPGFMPDGRGSASAAPGDLAMTGDAFTVTYADATGTTPAPS
jgi:Peptidase A4 family